jgi:starch synthase
LRILFVSSEAFPLAKTGGLADVCAALPAAIAQNAAEIRLMIPGYPQALDATLQKRVIAELPGSFPKSSRLVAGVSPISGLRVILFDCPRLFGRDGGLYQDDAGEDWRDNHLGKLPCMSAITSISPIASPPAPTSR